MFQANVRLGSGFAQVWLKSLVQARFRLCCGVWFRLGSGLVQVLFRFGPALGQAWFRLGSGFAQVWLRGLDQARFRFCSGLADGLC